MNADVPNSAPQNESDVEQKILFPLLTNSIPSGLGFDASDFITKPNIRNIRIGKGNDIKLYFPDYAVILNGIPSVIIEAKTPGENLQSALREARLYAAEINADYPNEVNPCRYLVVSDGTDVLLSDWDSSEVITSVRADEFNAVHENFGKLLDRISKRAITKYTNDFHKRFSKDTDYYRPTELLGGKAVQNESVGENSFGSNISVEYRYLFNPESREERNRIIINAYVESKRRNSHISPIDKVVRAAVPQYIHDSIEVENTAKPVEITTRLTNTNRVKNELCVLIGTVGSGKTTFTDFLRMQGLPADLRSRTQWVSINLNNAPMDASMIYGWVTDSILKSLQVENKEFDFDALEIIKIIHHAAIGKLRKGLGALYPENSEKWIEMLVSTLTKETNDKQNNLKLSMDFVQQKKNVHHIVVLDNCDKRSRDSQLLMFEVANWLKKEFPCTVFLPMRDTTYELYSTEPPLDTVIKDLVFRIDPPRLERVIYQRLKYAVREASNDKSSFTYRTKNGMEISCTRPEVSHYLHCIVDSLFQHRNFGRIVSGLAGRNIRLGLELVLNFCKSGHLSEEEIFKIRQSDGSYRVDHRVISRILFKSDRMYYSDGASAIRNLFYSAKEDAIPNPFCRLEILQLLHENRDIDGPSGSKGYHGVGRLIELTQLMGHDGARILNEINVLHKSELILSESMNDDIKVVDLVAIGPAGRVHLDLLNDIEYLSTVAEDTLMPNRELATTISKNISGKGPFQRYGQQSELGNAIALNRGLELSAGAIFDCLPVLGNKGLGASGAKKYLRNISVWLSTRADNDKKYKDATFLLAEYPPGKEVDATITSIQQYGFFVEFGLKGSGLVHKSNYGDTPREWITLLEEGDLVIVNIIEHSAKHGRFDLSLHTIPALS